MKSGERWPFSALIFPSAPALFPARPFNKCLLSIIFGEKITMFPYENLEVYKKAYSTNQKVYRLLKGNKSIPGYARDQLGRAAFSIMLNISEGSAKFSNKDRRNFYVTARGSAFESASVINFLNDEDEIPSDLCKELISNLEEISRMLFTMIKNLEE
jgi:four helix bundle protein